LFDISILYKGRRQKTERQKAESKGSYSMTCFDCDQSDCIRLYNEFTTLVHSIVHDVESLKTKLQQVQQAANNLKNARPTDMVNTDKWSPLQLSIDETAKAAQHAGLMIKQAAEAIHTVETIAKQVGRVATECSKPLLVCSRCKRKFEPTPDNASLHFGYKKGGSRYTNCCKCRASKKSQGDVNSISTAATSVTIANTITKNLNTNDGSIESDYVTIGEAIYIYIYKRQDYSDTWIWDDYD